MTLEYGEQVFVVWGTTTIPCIVKHQHPYFKECYLLRFENDYETYVDITQTKVRYPLNYVEYQKVNWKTLKFYGK